MVAIVLLPLEKHNAKAISGTFALIKSTSSSSKTIGTTLHYSLRQNNDNYYTKSIVKTDFEMHNFLLFSVIWCLFLAMTIKLATQYTGNPGIEMMQHIHPTKFAIAIAVANRSNVIDSNPDNYKLPATVNMPVSASQKKLEAARRKQEMEAEEKAAAMRLEEEKKKREEDKKKRAAEKKAEEEKKKAEEEKKKQEEDALLEAEMKKVAEEKKKMEEEEKKKMMMTKKKYSDWSYYLGLIAMAAIGILVILDRYRLDAVSNPESNMDT